MRFEDAGRLFLKTCDELERRIALSNEYEVLMSAGLLRKLLLDERPLAHQVNARLKLKLEFEIGQAPPLPPSFPEPVFFSEQDGLDPATARPGKVIRHVGFDEFLRQVVLKVKGVSYSVRDLIRFEADVMGAIHAGAPKDAREEQLEKVRDLYIGGLPASVRQLKAISRVVLKTLRPLRERVHVDLGS